MIKKSPGGLVYVGNYANGHVQPKMDHLVSNYYVNALNNVFLLIHTMYVAIKEVFSTQCSIFTYTSTYTVFTNPCCANDNNCTYRNRLQLSKEIMQQCKLTFPSINYYTISTLMMCMYGTAQVNITSDREHPASLSNALRMYLVCSIRVPLSDNEQFLI